MSLNSFQMKSGFFSNEQMFFHCDVVSLVVCSLIKTGRFFSIDSMSFNVSDIIEYAMSKYCSPKVCLDSLLLMFPTKFLT